MFQGETVMRWVQNPDCIITAKRWYYRSAAFHKNKSLNSMKYNLVLFMLSEICGNATGLLFSVKSNDVLIDKMKGENHLEV